MNNRTVDHAPDSASTAKTGSMPASKPPVLDSVSADGAQSAAIVAQRIIAEITEAVTEGETKRVFAEFLHELQSCIDSSITQERAIEMLSQHAITAPVFNALFRDCGFAKENPVSRAMDNVLATLRKPGELADDSVELGQFYDKVRKIAGEVDNSESRQQIIIDLYNKFFKAAFPKMAEMLGIVYTPIEVVDFILHSVNDVLLAEFGRRFSDENVIILDPFTGMGTFIARLIQSGMIDKNDLPRKYCHEIFANELVLLSYYIACLNIENCYHDAVGSTSRVPFPGIAWTDTFHATAAYNDFRTFHKPDSEIVPVQSVAPITVIIGNPPYSVGQKSANDNAPNRRYRRIDQAIKHSYAALSNSVLKRSLYDNYIRAFRYATDRLRGGGGVICFVTNGGWLDGSSTAGFRKSLSFEFSKIYVYNLRGDARKSGAQRRKESGNVFHNGSRTSVAITLLVKRADFHGSAEIFYRDIGDNLNRDAKLSRLRKCPSFLSPDMCLTRITQNEYGDWISWRNEAFSKFIPINSAKKFDDRSESVFITHSRGAASGRDVWAYNFSRFGVRKQANRMIAYYNSEVDSGVTVARVDRQSISWTAELIEDLAKGIPARYCDSHLRVSLYRPFVKQYIYNDDQWIQRRALMPKFFPRNRRENLVIGVNGLGSSKAFSALMSNTQPDVQFMPNGQLFPLYYYEPHSYEQCESKNQRPCAADSNYSRRDAISDFIHTDALQKYGPSITKEDIFFYVYGILHSPEYREKFAADLRKSLPRIPQVRLADDFWTFSRAGRDLADLHVNYETIAPLPSVTVAGASPWEFECARHSAIEAARRNVDVAAPGSFLSTIPTATRLRVWKMRFADKHRKDTIVFNSSITIENIPDKAYEYVVNGKSAIEWIMDRYQIRTDRDSGIVNDPNLYGEELGQPVYILYTLLAVIAVSVRTQEIVEGLPAVH